MADLYLRALESERKRLWATCRLKGLPRETPERRRIAELDGPVSYTHLTLPTTSRV